MTKASAVLAAVAVVVLTGCTAGSPTETPKSPALPPLSQSSTLTSEGLRGWPIDSLECPQDRPVQESEPFKAITGDVTTYVICPPYLGDPPQQQGKAVRTTASDAISALSAALAVPNETASGSPQPCALYANLPVYVLVGTSTGTWAAGVPRDECGHYYPDFMEAVEAARS